MKKRFSSRLTIGYKLFAFVCAGLLLFLIVRDLPQKKIGFFTLVASSALIFSLLHSLKLKDVFADENTLYITGVWRKITVPLMNISKISESWWGRNVVNTVIHVHLKEPSSFGRKVIFTPPLTLSFVFKGIGKHPMVVELEKLIVRAKERTKRK